VEYIDLVRKFLKLVRDREEQLTETLKSGSIQDYKQYQRIVGELSGLSFAEFTIKDLLDHKEDIDD
jgi:hypothetical protein